MAKQLEQQRYIYKIHSARLRKSKWNLTLPLEEARRNDEVISLASSQVLRWLDEINGITDADAEALKIRAKIKRIKSENNSIKNKHIIKDLYADLDRIQFKQDYLCLIIDKDKDYYRACKGFKINGIKYKRLLGTNGGIKNSTIVFINEKHYEEINRRIENGRDVNKPLVTAKLEAYRALACSASIPVSVPNGILVVPDCFTEFKSDVIYITDENSDEPIETRNENAGILMDATDGFGLMSPTLAARWSEELGLDYLMAGCNTRFSFEKGMVFTFDFVQFAKEIANENYLVKDVWGEMVDIRNVELILTESMLKLWDSYDSCDGYIKNCMDNGYTFGITKTCPKELENERNLNYQFIQSYHLSDEDIDELISPTVNQIKEVLGGDWRKTVLYLKGLGLSEDNYYKLDNDYVKAIMIEPELINDSYIQNTIYQFIKNRIKRAKVGVIKVHGNYSIASGDPYTLCQSIFGIKPTGLLKSGELYNKYWADASADNVVCFRAPMTCHNNIKKMKPVNSEDVRRWYRYMDTCTIFNSWDTTTAALNGMDFDGDLVMLTDNKVLVEKHRELPTLMCIQRKASKKVSSEDDFVKSNIESFGNEIGQTTNWITSMFEVQSRFNQEDEEYKVLDYRIRCGQLYQQNSIDKAKGIICKPMPRSWHDRHTVNKIENDNIRSFYRNVVAERKPYFMRYIYSPLMKQYKQYTSNTNKNSLREFEMSVDDLLNLSQDKLTDRQSDFIKYYEYRMPTGNADCVMNKICRRFENEFDGYVGRHNSECDFDYRIMKNDSEYSAAQYNAIKKIYDEYRKSISSYMVFANYELLDKSDYSEEISIMNEEFKKECSIVCPNEDVLCNIILDLCYQKSATKAFVWNMCGDKIIENLANKNRYISIPIMDDCGDIEYCGERFKVVTKELECVNGDNT